MSRFRDRCSGRASTPAPRSCRRRSSRPRTLKPSSRSARLPSCRPGRAPYQAAALAAVSELLAAFDLTQSRYSVAPDSLAEIADSGNSGGAVIGSPLPDWRRRDLMRTAVELRVDGKRSGSDLLRRLAARSPGRVHLAGEQPEPARYRSAGGSGSPDRLAHRSATRGPGQQRRGALRLRRRSAHVHHPAGRVRRIVRSADPLEPARPWW